MITNLLTEYWNLILIAIALYEAIARIIPTFKNYSIVEFVMLVLSSIHSVIDKYVPNKKK